jgi:uncharacterized protein YndB with AHSA1/START domain
MTAASREIVTERSFPVPLRRLYDAWSVPEQLTRWWGPEGFRNTFSEFDLRPGGYWRFIMSGPDGVDYRNESMFVEVLLEERIVFDHLSGHRFRTTAEFFVHEHGARLRWSMVFDDAEEYEKVREYIARANEENLDRLEALLGGSV